MMLLTKVSAAVAALGAAGLVVGLSLSPGVAAAFSDEATAGASISVASSLDCDVPERGIGCPKAPAAQGLLAEGNGGNGEPSDVTSDFGVTVGQPLPKQEPTLSSLAEGSTVTITLATGNDGTETNTAIGAVVNGRVTWSAPESWGIDEPTWENIVGYAGQHDLVVANPPEVDAKTAPSPDDGGQGQAAPGEGPPAAP